MDSQDKILSSMKLEKMVFEKIEFNRLGFKNSNNPKFNIESNFMQSSSNKDLFKVELIMRCAKEEEYTFEIKLVGFFAFDSESALSDDDRDVLISRNAIAIMMPYMRSQISLLTAQPEMDCIVLPTFNINSLIDKKSSSDKDEID